eukprot:4406668-Prymnesium_polylepis.1
MPGEACGHKKPGWSDVTKKPFALYSPPSGDRAVARRGVRPRVSPDARRRSCATAAPVATRRHVGQNVRIAPSFCAGR